MKRPKRKRRFMGPKNIREAIWLKAKIKESRRVFELVPPNKQIEIDWDLFTAKPYDLLSEIYNKLNLENYDLKKQKQVFEIDPQEQHIYVGNRWLFKPQLDNVIVKQNMDDTNKLSWLDRLIYKIIF